mgnify:CR=1 FL=1
MTREEAIAKALPFARKRYGKNLPVESTDYVCTEAILKQAEEHIEEARRVGNSDEAWEALVRAEAESFAALLAADGPYWVVRIDRCPPAGVVIDPSVYLVRVYERTGKVVSGDF